MPENQWTNLMKKEIHSYAGSNRDKQKTLRGATGFSKSVN